MANDKETSDQLKKLDTQKDSISIEQRDQLKNLTIQQGVEARKNEEIREMTEHSNMAFQQRKSAAHSEYQHNLAKYDKARQGFRDSMAQGFDHALSILGQMYMQVAVHAKIMAHAMNQALDQKFHINDYKHAASVYIKSGLITLKNSINNKLFDSAQRENKLTGILEVTKLVQLADDNTFQMDALAPLAKSGCKVTQEQQDTFNMTVLNWLETQGYTLQKDAQGDPTGKLVDSKNQVLTKDAFSVLRDSNEGLVEYQKNWMKPTTAPRPSF